MQLHLELAWTQPPPASPTSPWPPHINKWPSWAPAGLAWEEGAGVPLPAACPASRPLRSLSFRILKSPSAPPQASWARREHSPAFLQGRFALGQGHPLHPGAEAAGAEGALFPGSPQDAHRGTHTRSGHLWILSGKHWLESLGLPGHEKAGPGQRGLPKGLAEKPLLPVRVLSPHATAGAPASPRLWLGAPGPHGALVLWRGVEIDSSSPGTARTPGTRSRQFPARLRRAQ